MVINRGVWMGSWGLGEGAKKLPECHFVGHECNRKSFGCQVSVVKNMTRSCDGRGRLLLDPDWSSEFKRVSCAANVNLSRKLNGIVSSNTYPAVNTVCFGYNKTDNVTTFN